MEQRIKRAKQYNRKKKPWRKISFVSGTCRMVRKILVLCIMGELAVIAAMDGNFCFRSENGNWNPPSLPMPSQQSEVIEDTLEEGISLDWKNGVLHFWRRERAPAETAKEE